MRPTRPALKFAVHRADDRLLPVLLICAQAVVWPGVVLLRGAVPTASAVLVAVLVAGSVTAALALRRTRPVVTLVLVAAACALGAGPLPTGATAVLGTAGVGLALFTVATERDTFTAVLCGVTLAAWQLLQSLSLHGLSEPDGLDLVLTALLYATTCGAGLMVRRTRRVRRAAEQLLKRAETERHRLPAVERRRMERELHDVSAHHLTAVVVTAGAAIGLRERRPELGQEALGFAIETGREVTRALGAVRAPAPSREELPSPEERLRELAAGFRRLDQTVDCEIGPLPDGAVADAAFGIVREALTNVARHAPGARTTVRCHYGDTRTDVVVTSAAPPSGATVAAAHGEGLGGGRGQGFLRSRAQEAGGTLTSGPTAEGGWEVRAVLPGQTAAPVERSVPRSYRVAQVTAAAGLVLQPLLPVLVIRAETVTSGGRVSAGLLFALLAAAQVVALLWLRRSPRAALSALLGLGLLWPVAMVAGAYGGPVLLPPALSLFATCAALAAEATRTAASSSCRGPAGAGRAVPRAPERAAPSFAPLRGSGWWSWVCWCMPWVSSSSFWSGVRGFRCGWWVRVRPSGWGPWSVRPGGGGLCVGGLNGLPGVRGTNVLPSGRGKPFGTRGPSVAGSPPGWRPPCWRARPTWSPRRRRAAWTRPPSAPARPWPRCAPCSTPSATARRDPNCARSPPSRLSTCSPTSAGRPVATSRYG